MCRRLFILFFPVFILMCFAAHGGPVKKPAVKKVPPAVLKTDSSAVIIRSFNGTQIHNYLQDKDFVYDKNDVEGESLWQRFWNWFWRWVDRKVFLNGRSDDFYTYIEIGIGIVFLLFVLYKVTGINTVSIFRGKARGIALQYSESLENIHEVNFDAEIEKAIAHGNYRLAVRLLYLYSLKQLNDAGFINWQIEKTNSAYLTEIPDGENRQLFGLLTRQFEYVWYGDFYIDTTAFNEISALFKQFKQKVG